jgi:hypothetical protein
MGEFSEWGLSLDCRFLRGVWEVAKTFDPILSRRFPVADLPVGSGALAGPDPTGSWEAADAQPPAGSQQQILRTGLSQRLSVVCRCRQSS